MGLDAMFTVLLAAALAMQAPPPAAPSQPDTGSTVSLERIRRALEAAPSTLTLPPRKPDFVVEVNERQRFAQLVAPFLAGDYGVQRKRWFLTSQPQVGMTPPLAAVDLLAIASAFGRQLSDANRQRASSTARDDVRRAIAGYCAAQPNGGTEIRICMDPTSIR
jgi:hypothetical protein